MIIYSFLLKKKKIIKVVKLLVMRNVSNIKYVLVTRNTQSCVI